MKQGWHSILRPGVQGSSTSLHRRKALHTAVGSAAGVQNLRGAVDVLLSGGVPGRAHVGGKIPGVFLLLLYLS